MPPNAVPQRSTGAVARHLDHLALTADSPAALTALRERLTARGATDGRIDDLGAFHSVWFTDPDGTRAELVLIVDHNSTTSTPPPR